VSPSRDISIDIGAWPSSFGLYKHVLAVPPPGVSTDFGRQTCARVTSVLLSFETSSPAPLKSSARLTTTTDSFSLIAAMSNRCTDRVEHAARVVGDVSPRDAVFASVRRTPTRSRDASRKRTHRNPL
jgi:hypothetical protein